MGSSTAHPSLVNSVDKPALGKDAGAGSGAVTFVFLEIFSCEGGIQSYVKDILRAYLEQPSPAPADVFLLRDGAEVENPYARSPLRFHYFASAAAAWGRAKLVTALLGHLIKRRPQRVVCGHVLLLPLVAPLCRWLSLPYTVVTYGKEVWEPLPPWQQKALRQADQIWAISRYSRDRACAAHGLDPTRVHLVPCAVDGEVFCPGAVDPALVETYGLTGCRVLMTVARLWSGDIYKGVDVTLRALPAIAAAIPAVKYLVIGRGDDQPRLTALAKELGVSDRVVFAGFVPTEALVAHYRLASAYVMPSQEGFGIVYLEALACGVPVLSGDQDGSADPLQDGRLGWRVPHRDAEAVAAACVEMLSGHDRRCWGPWLRQETLAAFGPAALANGLHQALRANQIAD
ncbi:glycosyltransferase [Nodosilinea sp. LEGE 06152]|uniref:glycosyltransferase n=1 Tax=Nodosilinea sp. LEGE 06152 TaxID=2777966 RepID=UPI001882546C|nr:glycosyltransferase [Nodosilinea sp. LEGE 06152]MBE9156290.1 glycosyltransferase [Nodosilinea sp. LEGE 06152]